MKRFAKLSILVLILAMLCGCGKGDAVEVPDTNADGKLTCTLEIRCDTLCENLDQLKPEKAVLVPEDGTLLFGFRCVYGH